MPDPTFGDNGMVQQEFHAGGGTNPMDDDDFQAAQEACAEQLGGEDGGPGFMIRGGDGATSRSSQ